MTAEHDINWTAVIPPLVTPQGWWARFWYKLCPDCGMKIPNNIWQMSVVGYPAHYAVVHMGIPPFQWPTRSTS